MLILSRSIWRKLLATGLSCLLFVLLYDATVIDTRSSAREAADLGVPPAEAGAKLQFVATAYCKGDTTSAGVSVQTGIAAADPHLLPEGSVIEIQDVPQKYRGIYTVLDTGPMISGHHIDLYMWSCYEALDFGRRSLSVTLLRRGWDPKNTSPAIR